MNIREACSSIIGDDLARSIIDDMGIHWAVVAAMAEAKTSADPAALAAIDAWRAQQKHDEQTEGRTIRHRETWT